MSTALEEEKEKNSEKKASKNAGSPNLSTSQTEWSVSQPASRNEDIRPWVSF